MRPTLKPNEASSSPDQPTGLDQIAFLNTILESSIDYSIVALDLNGVILAWNEGARRLYGYTKAETLGKNCDLILRSPKEGDAGQAKAILAETLRNGKWMGNCHRMNKGGTTFMTHVTLTLRRSVKEEALGFTMISRELTDPERMAWELQNAEQDNINLTEKLQESQETFRVLTEATQQVFFVVSPDYKTMHYVSPSYTTIWGQSVESLYEDPKSWIEAIHPQDRERTADELTKHADGHVDFQYRIVRKDGSIRWIMARAGQIKDSTGHIKRLCGFAMDITDLKDAQLEVMKSELKYRRLFESAMDGILILDAGTGAISDINPFILNLLGRTEKECIGMKLWEIGFFTDIEINKRLFKDLQSTGYVRYEDVPLRTKGGRAVEVEFVSNRYTVGNSSVIQCNVRDITERKRNEEGFRWLASIVQNSDEAVLGASEDGTIRTWNFASENLFGYAAKEIIGQHVSILWPPQPIEVQENDSEHEIALGGQSAQPKETVRIGKDGKAIAVSFCRSLIKDAEGQLMGFSEFYRDSRKKNQLEARLRQSQKMEGIGRLAGGIAHDFNNLLTGILGYSEFLLAQIPESDSRRADVSEIIKGGHRAAALTRQLLAFSRQQVLTTSVIDINDCVGDLDKMLRRIIGEDIVLTFMPGADLGHIKVVPGQIEQIVMNLSINAKDAMVAGGRLLIETTNVHLGAEYTASHPDVKMGPYVMLSISDTGCGMNADVKSHLFEPFFTTKEQGKGTGLGLSTVYGIVQQNGGSIDVYSETDHGTTFKIYFPIVSETIASTATTIKGGGSNRGSETLLVVEDDETVRKFVSRVLSGNGYSVLVAATPEEAIAICSRHGGSIHLLLTDVVMPGMLGYELSRRLEFSMPQMKVIYMSGYTEQSIIQRALLRGASFIQKPMTTEDILRQVRQVLDATAGERADK